MFIKNLSFAIAFKVPQLKYKIKTHNISVVRNWNIVLTKVLYSFVKNVKIEVLIQQNDASSHKACITMLLFRDELNLTLRNKPFVVKNYTVFSHSTIFIVIRKIFPKQRHNFSSETL